MASMVIILLFCDKENRYFMTMKVKKMSNVVLAWGVLIYLGTLIKKSPYKISIDKWTFFLTLEAGNLV